MRTQINNQKGTLFISLIIFFVFLSLVISFCAGLIGLFGGDPGLGLHPRVSGWHGYLSLVVGLIGLASALASYCYIVTKFSLWIEEFLKSFIVRKEGKD